MKHQLISSANFVLILILILTLVVGEFTKINPPTQPKETLSLQSEAKTSQNQKAELPVSQIYGRRNIFGLPIDVQINEKTGLLIQSPEFAELKLPEKQALPPIEPKDNFIEPLNISINGIITSSNEENNACIISSSSGEERLYKAGDNVQDGIVMEITRNSVSIIRPNGQIEKFKVGEVQDPSGSSNIDSIVTKLEDNSFSIDYLKFSNEILSLGQLVEEFGIIPTYKDGICNGLKVTRCESGSFCELLGFKKGDIIISIDEISLCDTADRIKAYDKIIRMGNNDSFKVELERDSSKIVNTYTLEKRKPKIKTLAQQLGQNDDSKKTGKDGKDDKNKAAEADKKLDLFNKPAEDRERYSSNITAIRKKLLDNANKQRITHLR